MPMILTNVENVDTGNAVPDVFDEIPSPTTRREAETLLREMWELGVQTYAPDVVRDLMMSVASPVFTVTAIGHGSNADTVFRGGAMDLAHEVSAFLSHARYWQAYDTAVQLVGGETEARRFQRSEP